MGHWRIGIALLAGALLTAPAALAQQPPLTELEQSMGRRKTAPVIPPGVRAMVQEATANRLLVRSLDGGAIEVDISEMLPERFEAYGGGRFLGFAFNGYEYFGYRLVDRRMRGEAAVIETGEAPAFAPDGRHFAAVQVSGAGFGNLEGVAIWRVEAGRTVQILFSEVLPQGEDWRIDGWPRADCVSVSSVERRAAEGEPPAERRHFGIELGETLRLNASGGVPGCNVTDAANG